MRYYVLLVLVPGAAFAFASLFASALAAWTWPLVEQRTRRSAARVRARTVAAARLAPAAIGLLAAAAVAAAFLRFEPRDTIELPGVLLCSGAALLVTMCLLACTRIRRGLRAGARCSRLLRLGGELLVRPDGTRIWVLDSHYPVAAVIGTFRTRLLLSARLMRECSESELEAIVSHERAHVRRRDNLVRAAMLYLPDPSAAFAAAGEMETAWAAAAEEAADDAAAGDECERRIVLASALVRVARMATSPIPAWAGGLAFYEGRGLENRVRRLLAARSDGSARRGFGGHAAVASLLFASALLITEPVGQHLHAWMEAALRMVP